MNIYVGNLPYKLTEEKLGEVFAAYGEVSKVKIISDRETGRPKGFGFVEMPNAAEATNAIKGLDGQNVEGRNIKVNESQPREDRPARPRY
jgi:RNA recognition motif-containing protein